MGCADIKEHVSESDVKFSMLVGGILMSPKVRRKWMLIILLLLSL